MEAFRLRRREGRRRARRRCTTSAFALEQLGRLDEAEAAYGDAASRARDDAPHHARLGRSSALQAGRAPGGGGPARARARAAGRASRRRRSGTGPRRWRRPASDDLEAALATARAGVTALPGARGAAQQPRGAARAARATPPAPSRCCSAALADDPSLPQLSKNLGDLLYRARPLRRGLRGVRARGASWRPTWATTSTSSSATSRTSGGTRRGRAASWEQATRAQSGPPAGAGQPRHAGRPRHDGARGCGVRRAGAGT